MDIQLIKRWIPAVLLSMFLPATAMSQIGQILDTVQGYNSTKVNNLNFDDLTHSASINKTEANFTACAISPATGLMCLNDGIDFVNITDLNLADPNLPDPEFSCDNTALDLNTNSKKGPPCLSMTVNSAGHVYFTGREKGTAYRVSKAVKVGTDPCDIGPGAFRLDAPSSVWCVQTLATGRPFTDDMFALSGRVADDFAPDCDECTAPGSGEGVIVLERRQAVVFISDNGLTEVIAKDKRAWGVGGKTDVQSIALLQTADGENINNFIVGTATDDQIWAVNVAGPANGRPVFDVAFDRDGRTSAVCTGGDQRLGITSSIDAVIFLTDRNYCDALALVTTSPVPDELSPLARVGEAIINTPPLDAPMTMQGITVNLALCGVGLPLCILEVDPDGNPGATLTNAQPQGEDTNATFFHLTDMPECRVEDLWPECLQILEENSGLAPGTLTDPAVLFDPTVFTEAELRQFILDPTGVNGAGIGNTPAAWLLNVAPFVDAKPEITDLLTEALPDMWFQRWYHAPEVRGLDDFPPAPLVPPDPADPLDNHFDAYFVISDARMIGAADLSLILEFLTGDDFDCVDDPAVGTLASVIRETNGVAAKVSEDFISINRDFIAGDMDHESMQVNWECGSLGVRIARWSFIGLNLLFARDSFDEVSEVPTFDDEAFFLHYVESLTDDLATFWDTLACMPADGQDPAIAPVLSPTCPDTAAAIANMQDKIEKCNKAAIEKKTSLRDQNCQSARAHIDAVVQMLSEIAPEGQGDDPANRVAESHTRGLIIRHVFDTMTVPSFQDGGFNN